MKKSMNKKLLFLSSFLFLLISMNCNSQKSNQYIARQGEMSFFSYTSAENIKANNDQVLSLIDFSTGEIAVSILMRAFKFEKSLMEEHFNESYIESDLFPKASFEGVIQNLDPTHIGTQTRIVKGDFILKGIKKTLEFKIDINKIGDVLSVKGEVEILVKDFNIKIPPLLSPNIAKSIQVTFNFDYSEYEN